MTIGFDLCLRKCLSEKDIKCLDENEVVCLQSLNNMRDAAQHHMVELSKEHLYVYAQSALTLFTRLTRDVLGRPLSNEVPRRILPVCAKPPSRLDALFDVEFADIKRMVDPGSRKRLDAKAKLRSLAILQASLDGRKSQPTDTELDRIVKRVIADEGWRDIFPGVATLHIVPDTTGLGLSLQIKKKEGEAVQLVPEGTPNATVIAVKRVNELDFYSLGLTDLAKKLGVTTTKLLHFIRHKKMQEDPQFFKIIKIGGTIHKRYSDKCFTVLKTQLADNDLDEFWDKQKLGKAVAN